MTAIAAKFSLGVYWDLFKALPDKEVLVMGTFAQENIHENLFPLHDVEAKPNAESLQAIQEAEDFFVAGQKARFGGSQRSLQ